MDASLIQPVFARGGIGRLIVGLMEGDPVAWSITGGVIVIMIGWGVYKARSADG